MSSFKKYFVTKVITILMSPGTWHTFELNKNPAINARKITEFARGQLDLKYVKFLINIINQEAAKGFDQTKFNELNYCEFIESLGNDHKNYNDANFRHSLIHNAVKHLKNMGFAVEKKITHNQTTHHTIRW